jgi:signal recognition particle receptor subunit beta
VAVNVFDGVHTHAIEDIRDALAVGSHVPIVTCDARNRDSTKETLITLIDHALTMCSRGAPVNR